MELIPVTTSTTLAALAQALSAEFIGDPNLEIKRVVHPLQVQGPQDLALILDPTIVERLAQNLPPTALVPAELEIAAIPNQLKVRRPKLALARLLDIFERPVYIAPGIHPSAIIDPTAIIEENVSIGPLCWVGPETRLGKGTRLVSHVSIGGNVSVGENCFFHPGVVIGDRVQIGNRVILQANAAIGSDGFSYVTAEAGSIESAKSSGKVQAQNTSIVRINSIGTVVLEDEVEIGANSCVDRATLGETRIAQGTKVDNLVQIAHNVTIDQNCLIAAQTGIAGSTKIGKGNVFAGQVGVKDHATIGQDNIFLAKTGVLNDVGDRSIIIGYKGIPRKEYSYNEMRMKKAMAMPEQVKALVERVEALEKVTEGQPV
jgi:UDP-3-O-[3-hydroxymyristoyl] glucosamine N-acyltransferase